LLELRLKPADALLLDLPLPGGVLFRDTPGLFDIPLHGLCMRHQRVGSLHFRLDAKAFLLQLCLVLALCLA
jgi:hypothetical protein